MPKVELPQQIEMVPLESLRPVAWNPQVRDEAELALIKESIARHGAIVPVIARRSDGSIAGGHGRIAAIAKLVEEGWVLPENKVPVIFTDLSDSELIALNLALNHAQGSTNLAKAAPLLESLREYNDQTLLLATGFDAKSIDDLLWRAGSDARYGQMDVEGADELVQKMEAPVDTATITFSFTKEERDRVLRTFKKLDEKRPEALVALCAWYLGEEGS